MKTYELDFRFVFQHNLNPKYLFAQNKVKKVRRKELNFITLLFQCRAYAFSLLFILDGAT